MKANVIPSSELIINEDGSVFHLHLKPNQLAENVVLVGDPKRVDLVASFFDKVECKAENREFRAVTGCYKGKRITVLSTGIGCDNIDIVMNELDALVNVDFETRIPCAQLRSLNIVRIGTCGGLQPDCPVGTFIASEVSIGFDGLLNFYGNRESVVDTQLEQSFLERMKWENSRLGAHPYVVKADASLTERIAQTDMVRGITIACPGFYGPQGRVVRLNLADEQQNEKIMSFEYKGRRVTNFEMESSAIAGLSKLLGHKATTVCMVIANRVVHDVNTNYTNSIEKLIRLVLERI